MKKGLMMVLAALLMLSMSVGVSANTMSEDMESAILGAKEKLGIDDSLYVLEECYENEYRGQTEYLITWDSRDEYDTHSISVTADKEGNLWDLSKPQNSEEKHFPVGNSEQATEAAKTFLQFVNPQAAENTVVKDCTYYSYNGSYEVRFVRVHQGILVQNTVDVSVDGETNQVFALYSNWDKNATFLEGEMIPGEKAKEVFKAQIGYQLSYYVVTESAEKSGEPSKEVVRTIYTLANDNRKIDALSGTLVDLNGYDDDFRVESGAVADKNTVSGGGNASLSEEEIAYLQEMSALITKEEAEKILRAVPEFAISKDLPLYKASLQKNATGEYNYSLTFTKGKDDEKPLDIYVSLSAEDGTVLTFMRMESTERKEQTEQEKQKATEKNSSFAEAFLKKYYPDYADKTEVLSATENNVSMARKENGIPFENNGFGFSFEQDGTLSYFGARWTEAEVPAIGAVKSMDELYETLLTEENFPLSYYPEYQDNQCTMRPVYYLKNTENYDPYTLKVLGSNMLPEAEKASGYTDIENHYGETAILAMYDAGFILGDETATEFAPTGTVKQEEFLMFINNVIGYGPYRLYPRLLEKGVLTKEEIAPEKEITRMEAIRYIVGILDFAELADKAHIFADIYTDVAEDDKGYAAIAAGYGIVNSEVTELYPEHLLKRSDAVIMMYNWLTK